MYICIYINIHALNREPACKRVNNRFVARTRHTICAFFVAKYISTPMISSSDAPEQHAMQCRHPKNVIPPRMLTHDTHDALFFIFLSREYEEAMTSLISLFNLKGFDFRTMYQT